MITNACCATSMAYDWLSSTEGYVLIVECMLDASGNGIEIEIQFDKKVLSFSGITDLMSQLKYVVRQLQPYNWSNTALSATQR